MLKGLKWLAIIGAYLVKMANDLLVQLVIIGLGTDVLGPVLRFNGRAHLPQLELVVLTIISAALNIISGYLVVVWASQRPLAQAIALAILTSGIDSFLYFGNPFHYVVYPTWYVFGIVLTPAFCVLGGWLRVQTRGLNIKLT